MVLHQDPHQVNLNQRSGGSFRVVINTKDWDNSFATNSPGQSGDPNSKFYKNST